MEECVEDKMKTDEGHKEKKRRFRRFTSLFLEGELLATKKHLVVMNENIFRRRVIPALQDYLLCFGLQDEDWHLDPLDPKLFFIETMKGQPLNSGECPVCQTKQSFTVEGGLYYVDGYREFLRVTAKCRKCHYSLPFYTLTSLERQREYWTMRRNVCSK